MKFPGFYSLVLEDSASVASAWMPFLRPAGLFVTTRKDHILDEEIVLLIQLPGGAKQSLAGRVAWISAESSPGGRRRGIGVALEGPDGQALAAQIKQLLSDEDAPAETLLAFC